MFSLLHFNRESCILNPLKYLSNFTKYILWPQNFKFSKQMLCWKVPGCCGKIQCNLLLKTLYLLQYILMFKNGTFHNFVFIYSRIDVLATVCLEDKFHYSYISYNHILPNQQKLSFWKCVSKTGLVLIEPITPCFESTSMHAPIKPNKGKTNMIFVPDFFYFCLCLGQ